MLLAAKRDCATLSTLPCLTRPVSSHRGKLRERQALLLWPWTPIGMSLTNTPAAKRELLGAETQPLHRRSSCQGPGVIPWPVLEDPDPNMLSGAHTFFYVCKVWGMEQAEQQEHFLPCCQQTWKTTNCGAGRDCGSNLCTADWSGTCAWHKSLLRDIVLFKKFPPEWSVLLQLW